MTKPLNNELIPNRIGRGLDTFSQAANRFADNVEKFPSGSDGPYRPVHLIDFDIVKTAFPSTGFSNYVFQSDETGANEIKDILHYSPYFRAALQNLQCICLPPGAQGEFLDWKNNFFSNLQRRNYRLLNKFKKAREDQSVRWLNKNEARELSSAVEEEIHEFSLRFENEKLLSSFEDRLLSHEVLFERRPAQASEWFDKMCSELNGQRPDKTKNNYSDALNLSILVWILQKPSKLDRSFPLPMLYSKTRAVIEYDIHGYLGPLLDVDNYQKQLDYTLHGITLYYFAYYERMVGDIFSERAFIVSQLKAMGSAFHELAGGFLELTVGEGENLFEHEGFRQVHAAYKLSEDIFGDFIRFKDNKRIERNLSAINYVQSNEFKSIVDNKNLNNKKLIRNAIENLITILNKEFDIEKYVYEFSGAVGIAVEGERKRLESVGGGRPMVYDLTSGEFPNTIGTLLSEQSYKSPGLGEKMGGDALNLPFLRLAWYRRYFQDEGAVFCVDVDKSGEGPVITLRWRHQKAKVDLVQNVLLLLYELAWDDNEPVCTVGYRPDSLDPIVVSEDTLRDKEFKDKLLGAALDYIEFERSAFTIFLNISALLGRERQIGVVVEEINKLKDGKFIDAIFTAFSSTNAFSVPSLDEFKSETVKLLNDYIL
ncbi:hypothetical protein [Cerasicoccus frondis]|uniref:hypothetical protein n=1 Tax=Cerasicoccus frondis TaxID=490090 RepID=UPI002852C779|nr:hypothetical protein [Cerasicoccus frondis]